MPRKVTVKSGDTLSQIALAHGISVGDISGYSSGNPNLIYPGEVLTLSDIGSSLPVSDIQAPPSFDLPSTRTETRFEDSATEQVDKYRKEFERVLMEQRKEMDENIKVLRAKEKETLKEVKGVTAPFREDLEKAERERLYINKNFEENQALINELDQLLTEGNDLIKQQQEITGLAAVRNPRIQKTMDDVKARTGVIEAVINARNGQIAQAQTLIDRSIDAIAADRNDQLIFYEAILELDRLDISKLEKTDKALAEKQLDLIKGDLTRAEETADYIKELLIDPATASLMGEAGVSLNDSVENINIKLTEAQHSRDLREFSNEIALEGGVAVTDPKTVPADQLVTYTDANNKKHYYKLPKDGESIISAGDPRVQTWVNAINSGAATLSQVPSALKTSVMAALGAGAGGLDMDFEEFLELAQEEQKQTFTKKLRDELEIEFNVLKEQAAGDTGNAQMIEDYASTIILGYATLSSVPKEMRQAVLRRITELAEKEGVEKEGAEEEGK